MKTLFQLKKFSKKNKYRDVKYEKIFRKLCVENDLLCQYQRQRVIGYYIVDFLFKSRMLIVEIDESHHKHQVADDKKRQLYLESLGFKVLRVPFDSNFLHYIGIIKNVSATNGKRIRAQKIMEKINGKRSHETTNLDHISESHASYLRHRELDLEFKTILQ